MKRKSPVVCCSLFGYPWLLDALEALERRLWAGGFGCGTAVLLQMWWEQRSAPWKPPRQMFPGGPAAKWLHKLLRECFNSDAKVILWTEILGLSPTVLGEFSMKEQGCGFTLPPELFALLVIHFKCWIRRMTVPGSALMRNVWESVGRIAPTLCNRKSTPTLGRKEHSLNFHFPLLWEIWQIWTFPARSQMHLSYPECPSDHDIILKLCLRQK